MGILSYILRRKILRSRLDVKLQKTFNRKYFEKMILVDDQTCHDDQWCHIHFPKLVIETVEENNRKHEHYRNDDRAGDLGNLGHVLDFMKSISDEDDDEKVEAAVRQLNKRFHGGGGGCCSV